MPRHSCVAEPEKKIRKDAVLSNLNHYCGFGPEDLSSNLPKAEKKQEHERRKLTEHGESIKRGCQYHFSVTVRARTPDIAELRVFQGEHVNS